MSIGTPVPPDRRVAVRAEQAAEMLSVSRDFFDARIAPELPVIDLGRVKLYALAALSQWAERHGQVPVGR